MTSRGSVVEAEVDDVTAAALEAMSQSCLLSKVVGASPPLLTSGRGCGPCSSRTGYHLGSQPKLQVTATKVMQVDDSSKEISSSLFDCF